MFAKGQTVIQLMESLAPKHLAVPEDRIGLQLGTLQKEVQRILITLDVTEAVVDEAIELGADLIIAHHAIIFRPLKHLQTDTPSGRLYEKLIKHDIAVYISHTNLDVAEGGVNDLMAEALGLQTSTVLEATYEEPLYKLVTFVPKEQLQLVRESLFAKGAGKIGEYSRCSFNLEGMGTFFPEEGTNPFIGTTGKLEQVEEIRIETIVPESRLKEVLQALHKSHPYEEPAYDVYPLALEGKKYGLGRVGALPKSLPLAELAEKVKQAFNVPHVRVVGDLQQSVAKVAVLGGSGSRYIRMARRAGADVFITGDIDFHTAQDALNEGLSLIDPGHHAEKIMIQHVANYMNEQLKSRYQTMAFASKIDTNPFQWV